MHTHSKHRRKYVHDDYWDSYLQPSKNVTELVRRTEGLNKKLINDEYSLGFHTTCLKEHILPTDANIYICICMPDSIADIYMLIEKQKMIYIYI